MRSVIVSVGLVVLAGCVAIQRPATVQRSAVSAAACDSAASVVAERERLVTVVRTLADISNGAGANAYSAAQMGSVAPSPAAGAPSPSAAAVTSSTIANANNARIELWSEEARRGQNESQAPLRMIGALDAARRTLPTARSCGAAGFARFAEPAG